MKTKTTTIASQQTVQFLRDTIQRFETAILVTHGPGGELRARPMVISDTSSAGEMWFITNDATPKVVELKQDARAMAIMQAPGVQVCSQTMPSGPKIGLRPRVLGR